jgi:hypothetical protein
MIFFEMFAFNGWLSPPPPPIPIGPVPLSTLSTLSTFEQPLTLLLIHAVITTASATGSLGVQLGNSADLAR